MMQNKLKKSSVREALPKPNILQLSEYDITQKIMESLTNACHRSVLFSITNDSSRLCLEQLKQFTIGTTLKEIPAKIGMDLEHPLPVSKAVQFEMTI